MHLCFSLSHLSLHLLRSFLHSSFINANWDYICGWWTLCNVFRMCVPPTVGLRIFIVRAWKRRLDLEKVLFCRYGASLLAEISPRGGFFSATSEEWGLIHFRGFLYQNYAFPYLSRKIFKARLPLLLLIIIGVVFFSLNPSPYRDFLAPFGATSTHFNPL